jgi:hypothetical protein
MRKAGGRKLLFFIDLPNVLVLIYLLLDRIHILFTVCRLRSKLDFLLSK